MLKLDRRHLALLAAIAVLFALPIFGVPGFYTTATFRNLIVDNLPLLLAATGMTIVILVGQIDISVGSQFVVSGVVAGLAARAGLPMPVVVLLTLAAGAAFGAFNGLLVTRLGLPAIIATLATLVLGRNAIILFTGGDWIQNLPANFQWFGLAPTTAQLLYIVFALALFAVLGWALRHLAVGRSVYAVGCDHEAARRIGLQPLGVVFGAFVALGVLTALAAILNFTRYPTIETNAGLGFELKVIAAVVVGGTAITGGRGSVLGTLLGVILLGAIGTVFTFLHVNPAWERAIQGLIILLAVVSDTAWQSRFRSIRTP
jgi:rhamnose transport system permease protein